jgi:hypothetical protein
MRLNLRTKLERSRWIREDLFVVVEGGVDQEEVVVEDGEEEEVVVVEGDFKMSGMEIGSLCLLPSGQDEGIDYLRLCSLGSLAFTATKIGWQIK